MDAHQLYRAGDFKAAAELCEAKLEQEPENLSTLLLVSACYFMLRDFENSMKHSLKAISVDPSFAEAYGNAGNVHKERGQLEDALSYYRKALELKEHYADAHGNMAGVLLQQQKFDEAAKHYTRALQLNEHNACWLVDLGHIYRVKNKRVDAKMCFIKATNVNPHFAIAFSNLACIYKDEGNVMKSVENYKHAIELDPKFVDAYANLGNVYKDSGQLQPAKEMYTEALRLNPQQAIVWGNLAAVYLELGKITEALELFEKTLKMQPNFPDALSNQGNALKFAGRLEESIQSYRKALELQPNHTDALNNLANTYKDAGDAVTAEQMYRRAIALRPQFAGAHSNLGNLLKEQHRLLEALAEYDEALQADPQFADAWSNRGNALKDLGRFDEAITAYKQAIQIRPTFADALGNLASVFKDTGKLEDAISYYRKSLRLREGITDAIAYSNLVHCLQTVCQWDNRDAVFAKCKQLIARQMAKGQVPSVQPHHALVYPLTGDEQLEIAVHYARAALKHVRVLGLEPQQPTPLGVASTFNSLVPLEKDCFLTAAGHEHVRGFDVSSIAPAAAPAASAHPLHPIAKGLTRRMRVGYVSSDFGNHPLAHLMNHVFVWHDPARFEVFAYATSLPDGSEWRAKIQAGVEHFVEVAGLAHEELAARIRADNIDVLVNLNGYTKGSRNEVFALRPAPVQLMYLGFPGSSGSHYMQYYVTDQVASPQQLQHLYTEKLAYMPHCYFVNDHAQSYAEQAKELSATEIDVGRAQYGLPPRSDGIVLAMFNQLYKIDPQVFSVWCAVLKAVPTAVLWLLQFPPAGEANIREQAARQGVRPEQLVFSPVATKEEHISRGRYADLFLDTPLCNAHTTGTDILWGGVPVVTLPLESLASRVGASLLAGMGMPELICRNLQDYQETVIQLCSDLPALRTLQARTRAARYRMSLFDTQRWVAHWQTLLVACMRDYRLFAEHCAVQGRTLEQHMQEGGVWFTGLPDTSSGGAGNSTAARLAAAAAAMSGAAVENADAPPDGPFASANSGAALGDGAFAPGVLMPSDSPVADAGTAPTQAAVASSGNKAHTLHHSLSSGSGSSMSSPVSAGFGMYECLQGRTSASATATTSADLLNPDGTVNGTAIAAATVTHVADQNKATSVPVAAPGGKNSPQLGGFSSRSPASVVQAVPGAPVTVPVINEFMGAHGLRHVQSSSRGVSAAPPGGEGKPSSPPSASGTEFVPVGRDMAQSIVVSLSEQLASRSSVR